MRVDILVFLCASSLLGLIAFDMHLFADSPPEAETAPTAIDKLEESESIRSRCNAFTNLESQLSGVQQAGGVALPSITPPLPSPLNELPSRIRLMKRDKRSIPKEVQFEEKSTESPSTPYP